MERATWTVTFTDGTSLSQYDTTSPLCHEPSGEVPYRAIDWSRVQSILLESQWVAQSFDFHGVPDGRQVSLRSRHVRTVDGADGVMCYMIVTSLAGEDVSDASTESVVYWFPDGSVHECPHFNCPDVAEYSQRILWGLEQPGIMPMTSEIAVAADALTDSPSATDVTVNPAVPKPV